MTQAIDFDTSYVLPPDVPVIVRGPTTVQIGIEPPRRLLLVDAPPHAGQVLGALGTAGSIGDAIRRAGDTLEAWRPLLDELVDKDFLIPAGAAIEPDIGSRGEYVALTHQHGATRAARLLSARADSLVLVEGPDPVGDTIASVLAASGIGHIYQPGRAPDRYSRAWDSAPHVRVYRPAPQHTPSLVVLAGSQPLPLSRAAELVTALVPHLAVRVTQARAIIGPLVLPGRSACLNCLDLHRADADDAWPRIADELRRRPLPAAPVTAHMAATFAAAEALRFIDGMARPESIDSTIEYLAASSRIRHRRWAAHPDCGCGVLRGRL